jgi:excinuclease ABC subunit A
VELGPGAGKKGGQIVAQGTWAHLETRDTLTRRAGEWGRSHPLTGARRPCPGEQGWLVVEGARVHNLKNLTVRVPLGRLVVVCGPSGAGKSTLLCHVLLAAVWEETSGKHCQGSPGQGSGGTAWTRVAGAERLGGVRLVDGEPIGKTPRSTPATYIGLMNLLREFFSTLPLARQRGYGPGRFSYNNREGRCPDCRGCGFLKAELPLLPPTVLRCPRCKGSRFNPQTLEVTYRGKHIAEVLEMTAEEALELFRGLPRVERKLALLCQVGLGYLPLGQPSPSLSGGEAQRVKLVAELQERSESHSVQVLRSRRRLLPYLYLLEEPTIGLHRDDVTSLLTTLQALVAQGHTVVVVEHHPGVIAEADWVIELGPGAAEEGGKIVVEGTPEEVARCSFSPTAPYLRPVLGL